MSGILESVALLGGYTFPAINIFLMETFDWKITQFANGVISLTLISIAIPLSTKSEEQKRRAAKHTSAKIDVACHIKATVSQAASDSLQIPSRC